MPSLADRKLDLVKALFIGDSGVGKTGLLASLAVAGYKLHICDYDNGLDALQNFIQVGDPSALANVDYEPLHDQTKFMQGAPPVVAAKALMRTGRLIEKWSDGSRPAAWGPEHVFVLDSLTSLGRYAYNWAQAQAPKVRDRRQWYNAAQDSLELILDMISSTAFNTNVIVISHIKYVEVREVGTDGKERIKDVEHIPSSVGNALGKTIPQHFNTFIGSRMSPTGKREVCTQPVPGMKLPLKNPAPMRLKKQYPPETALADIFKELTGDKP